MTLQVKIVNKAGQVVPLGEQGEILVRSPLAFKGYLQPESKGAVVDAQGWLHMDDAGIMAPGGYLKVLGRMSFVISRGITITYPAVVEQFMVKCAAVDKAAVVGVPDKRLGEEIAAFVVAKKGQTLSENDLKKFFGDQYQTDEGLGMTPGYFLIVDEFPLNANGKVDTNELKKIAVDKLDL